MLFQCYVAQCSRHKNVKNYYPQIYANGEFTAFFNEHMIRLILYTTRSYTLSPHEEKLWLQDLRDKSAGCHVQVHNLP